MPKLLVKLVICRVDDFSLRILNEVFHIENLELVGTRERNQVLSGCDVTFLSVIKSTDVEGEVLGTIALTWCRQCLRRYCLNRYYSYN